jgi:hypothetical protein
METTNQIKKAPSANWRRVGVRLVGLLCFILTTFSFIPAKAQSSDLTQLILDIEKLTQLKGILSDMKTGYNIIDGGYNQVKSISQGNFNLHSTFLNGLLMVSPAVAKYGRIADIILEQGYIITEYQRSYNQFRQSGTFSADEIAYLANVYTTLLQQSLQNLDQLTTVLTAGKLRMSDDERLKAVDHIYADTDDKLTFLRHFDQQTTILSIQRQKAMNDLQTLQKLY